MTIDRRAEEFCDHIRQKLSSYYPARTPQSKSGNECSKINTKLTSFSPIPFFSTTTIHANDAFFLLSARCNLMLSLNKYSTREACVCWCKRGLTSRSGKPSAPWITCDQQPLAWTTSLHGFFA